MCDSLTRLSTKALVKLIVNAIIKCMILKNIANRLQALNVINFTDSLL